MQAILLVIIHSALLAMSQDTSEDFPKNACNTKCADGTCIANDLWCNGEINCLDASDELQKNCHSRICDDERIARCGYGACIAPNQKCDYNIDCADGSDENFAKCKNTLPCPSNKFQCGSGGCVDLEKKCDGKFDCPDQTDEYPPLCE